MLLLLLLPRRAGSHRIGYRARARHQAAALMMTAVGRSTHAPMVRLAAAALLPAGRTPRARRGLGGTASMRTTRSAQLTAAGRRSGGLGKIQA
eukprot:SAG31_NODE_1460_length_8241_cov_11.816352_11_plen_93_part_00